MLDQKALEAKISALEALVPVVTEMSASIKKLTDVSEEAKGKTEFDITKQVGQLKAYPRGGEEKFSLARAVSGVLGVKDYGFEGSWNRYPFEKAVMEASQAQLKAMGETTTTAGGFLVPPQYITDLIEVVRARSITRSLGVRRYPTNSNAGYIPRQTGVSTAAWLGEAATITASDLVFDQIAFTIRKLAAYAVVSNELIADANPAVDAIVREDISAAMALKEDYTVLYGTGTAPEPRGIKNATGVTLTSLGANGATPSFDNLIDLEANIRQNNRSATGWAAAVRTTTTLRKIKDSQGHYLWAPAASAGFAMPYGTVAPVQQAVPAGAVGAVQAAQAVGMVNGIPYFESTQIPVNLTQGTATNSSDIFVGQWDEVVVIERAGLELAASDQILFQNYQTAIRAIMREDIIVRHGSAFAVAIGLLP